MCDSQQGTAPIGFLFLKLPPPPCAVLLVRESYFQKYVKLPYFMQPQLFGSQVVGFYKGSVDIGRSCKCRITCGFVTRWFDPWVRLSAPGARARPKADPMSRLGLHLRRTQESVPWTCLHWLETAGRKDHL